MYVSEDIYSLRTHICGDNVRYVFPMYLFHLYYVCFKGYSSVQTLFCGDKDIYVCSLYVIYTFHLYYTCPKGYYYSLRTLFCGDNDAYVCSCYVIYMLHFYFQQ